MIYILVHLIFVAHAFESRYIQLVFFCFPSSTALHTQKTIIFTNHRQCRVLIKKIYIITGGMHRKFIKK